MKQVSSPAWCREVVLFKARWWDKCSLEVDIPKGSKEKGYEPQSTSEAQLENLSLITALWLSALSLMAWTLKTSWESTKVFEFCTSSNANSLNESDRDNTKVHTDMWACLASQEDRGLLPNS